MYTFLTDERFKALQSAANVLEGDPQQVEPLSALAEYLATCRTPRIEDARAVLYSASDILDTIEANEAVVEKELIEKRAAEKASLAQLPSFLSRIFSSKSSMQRSSAAYKSATGMTMPSLARLGRPYQGSLATMKKPVTRLDIPHYDLMIRVNVMLAELPNPPQEDDNGLVIFSFFFFTYDFIE
jgi:hypothetical protein